MPKKILKIRDRTIFDGYIMKVILKGMFKTWFALTGWKLTTIAPEGAGVTIAAPHTSNWDVVYAFGSAVQLDIKIYFSIKESWCKMPVIGSLLLWCGAIPIDRRSRSLGQINKIKHFVNQHKDTRIFFLFTPEATRAKVTQWNSGFYHMAKHCHLPIFLAKVDYRTKESGVFHIYKLTDDKKADIASIQQAYANVQGKFPANQFPPYTGHVR
jgi:1-acyl-sn-glycerol-3-phosphate acyltransferase